MTSKTEIIEGVNSYFEGEYQITEGRTIPDIADIPFGKNGKEMELAMLFIDIRESTRIVSGIRRITAARMYKSFLWGVSKIARQNGGELRSFNGDGVLVVFDGDTKCTHAAKTALQLSWFVKDVLKPKLDVVFANNQQLKGLNFSYGIGIDTGKVLIVRGGMKGENNNDLVWVGNATNYAVKLSNIKEEGYNIYITHGVYSALADSSKYGGADNKNMWEKRSWTAMNGIDVYRSNWYWRMD
jgi:adenylate cyclase